MPPRLRRIILSCIIPVIKKKNAFSETKRSMARKTFILSLKFLYQSSYELQQDEDLLVGLQQQLEVQRITKGEVEGAGGVGIIGQQQGFTFLQNIGTPQNKTHELHVTVHPQEHMKKHPLSLYI
jgi:hypothetical protein